MENGNHSGNSGRKQSAQNRISEINETRNLMGDAREYFAEAFANPQREGCPSPGTINSVVRSGRLPESELREHLFGCSECFREYRAALAIHQHQHETAAGWWERLWRLLALHPIPAAVATLAILTIGISWYWIHSADFSQTAREKTTVVSPSLVNSVPAPTPDSSASEPGSTGVESTRRVPENQMAAVIAPVDLSVDLNDKVALRGAQENTDIKESIGLTQRVIRLHLQLPEGSASGKYTVSLIDTDSRRLTQTHAVSRDGRRLNIGFDLTRVAKGRYRLQLQHRDEPPDFYPVIVIADTSKSK